MNERDALALEQARAAGWPDPPVNPCAEIHLPDGPRISPTGRAMPDVPELQNMHWPGGQVVPPATADYVHRILNTPSPTMRQVLEDTARLAGLDPEDIDYDSIGLDSPVVGIERPPVMADPNPNLNLPASPYLPGRPRSAYLHPTPEDAGDVCGTHQYFNSFRDWREYVIRGDLGMRQDAWDGFKLVFVQPFRLAWYATRDTVAAHIFIWTNGKVNLGARIYENNAADANKPVDAPKPYPHAMAHRTGTRALDLKYDRPWWRRFIARDFG